MRNRKPNLRNLCVFVFGTKICVLKAAAAVQKGEKLIRKRGVGYKMATQEQITTELKWTLVYCSDGRLPTNTEGEVGKKGLL